MTGGSGSERGIVPRAMEQLLRQAGSMRADGWEVNISMSFVELYNEVFRDLLNPEAGSRVKVGLANERVTISGLSTETLDSGGLEAGLTHLQQLLDKAVSARTVACTLLNETSSRSHMIFLIDITCRHPNGSILLGGLRFADLAGSERLDRTGTASDAARLRETTSINKSLSCLGDVFSAIGSKQSHVPYRNSKLTTILQDCFTGDGKTLLLVSISPTLASAGETLCSLRFATQVNRVELGKASKNAFLAPPAHLLPPLPPAISVNESTAVVKPSQLLGSALLTDRSRPLKRAMHAIEEDAEVENRYAPNGALSFLSSSRGYKSTAGGGGGATKRISTFLHGSFVGRESVAPSSGSSHSFLSGANAMSSRNDTTASFPAVERRKLFTRPTGGGGWR